MTVLFAECNCVCRDIGHWEPGPADPECEWCKGTGKRVHPKMNYTRWHAVCPKCGFKGDRDLQAFDVIGSDCGCVFCPECHQEICAG